MKEEYWQLLAKLMAKEADSQEEELAKLLLKNDKEFKQVFFIVEELWHEINEDSLSFDRDRIIALMKKGILKKEEQHNKFKIHKAWKYAAAFIGAIIGLIFLITDLNKTTIITSDNSIIKDYKLPDGSTLTLNKETTIQFSSSIILGFDREVNITKGEAFFEITKQKGQGFIVHTPCYDVNVLGTKFDINIDNKETSIVLCEGSVILNNITSFDKEIEMIPGDKIVKHHSMINPIITKNVNPEIYTLWSASKLEFNNFTMQDMKIVFRHYYKKELIIKDKNIARTKLGGSAPLDDLNLILKGLSSVLKREIINKHDSIIIN